MKNILFFFLLIALTNINAQEVVKVGAFNFYPGIFQDTDGVIKGFYVDALNELAEKENKKFIYVYGSWDEGLQRIKNGEVDMLMSVAFTEERSGFMDYANTPLLTVWSEVYVNSNSEIKGILDLEGKTVAFTKSDFNGAYLKQLTSKLSINCEFIETNDFEEVFNLIASKKVDAGVVNNSFGFPKFKEYNLQSSGIIFNPFDIFFTVKKGTNGELLKLLDEHLNNWKYDRNSIYNVARQKWSHDKVGSIEVFPQWLQKGIYLTLIVVFILIIFIALLRYKVSVAIEKVKYSETLFKTFMENTPSNVYIKDHNLNHIYRNKKVENVNNISSSDKFSSAKTIFEPHIAEMVEKTDRKILNSESKQLNLQYFCKLKGENIWLHDYKFYLKLPNGEPGVGGVSFDITKLKETEQKLIEAKEKAEASNANVTAIIEGTTNSIWNFNRNYEIIFINKVFQQEFLNIFGVFLEPGVNLIESLPESIRPIWIPRYDRVLANEQFVVEDAIDTDNGIIYIQVGFNPIVEKGIVVGGSCFGSNITSRKLDEKELVNAREKAEESDRLKSAFLANMSHEIRTPMNGILGFSELLKTPNLTGEKQQKYIEVIEKSGARMLNIINDIVDISRIEAGLIKVDITESNVNEQIEYINTFFKPEVEAKGLTLLFKNNLPSKEAVIKTDREKLFAILTNLVKNAIKYTYEGSIEFGYHKKGDNLEFYVKDTGIGIPKNRQEAIFERFIQADISDKMARQGAGLGLSISKAYVEILGGKIWVESQEGKGSVFYFTIPYNAELKKESGIGDNVEFDTEGNYLDSKVEGLKILIADDDENSSSLISITVSSLSSEIIKVETGIEAIEACRNNPDIDLVLMDAKMPGMDGYSATQQIRQFNKEIVIIAQTAYGLRGDREKALAAGCNDYISKPIDRKLLTSMIRNHCN